ncbi:MAG: acyl-CoA dehydrogenase family protein [Pseudomonadota bacterium]
MQFDDWLSDTWRERLSDLCDSIAAGAAESERSGRLAATSVAALAAAGVTNLYLPRTLGGEEVDPVTCALVTEAIARCDSAAAWFVMVANSPRLLAASWPQALVERLWRSDPHTIVAASGHTMLQGEACGDQIVVDGTVRFASGAHHAQWIAAPCLIAGATEADEARRVMAIVPAERCEILDDWDSVGMRGTGSNSVRVPRVAIPAGMTAPIAAELRAANDHYSGPLYRCPGRVLFATYVPISLATAARALEVLSQLAANKTPAAADALLRERAAAQMKYGRALAVYRSAREYFLAALHEAWERALRGESATAQQRADLYLAGTHGVQAAAETVRLVADAAGTSAVDERAPLARLVRDMETLRQHGFASENRYASVAQQLWGAQLDYPLLLR